MKKLLDEIRELKQSQNIEQYRFEDKNIYIRDRFRTGKILNLHTIHTIYPEEFPSGQMDLNLLREIGLLQGWKVADFAVYSFRYYFELYKLWQTELFEKHCQYDTCYNMYDNQKGTIKLAFRLGRNSLELDKFERKVLQRLSYITEAQADYGNLGATIRIEPHKYQPGKSTYSPCPDCKDGYYYPLIGKREPCETCN